MTYATFGGTMTVAGTVRETPGGRWGRDPHREPFVAGGRSVPDVAASERTGSPDPDPKAGGGVLGR